MPAFASPTTLSPEQIDRWDEAVSSYTSLMESAASAMIAKMPESVRLSAESTGLFNRCMGILSAQWAGVGHPKSALFARLLEGKEPLPHPPPLRYSYPWYAVVELPGPWQVSVSPVNEDVILIEQGLWSVVSANEAGRALLRNRKYTFSELDAIYAAAPEIVVTCERWPPYVLRVAPIVVQRERRCIHGRHRHDRADAPYQGSAFDVYSISPNATISKRLAKAEPPRERLAWLKNQINQADASSNDAMTSEFNAQQAFSSLCATANQTEYDNLVRNLQDAELQYQSDPEGGDLVEVSIHAWSLHKCGDSLEYRK